MKTLTILSVLSMSMILTVWTTFAGVVPGILDHQIHMVYTGSQITVEWDQSGMVDHYKAKLFRWESDEELVPAALATIPGNQRQVTFTMPRLGHYVFHIKACNKDESLCSDWITSADETQTHPNPSWMIYSFPAPVTQGGIN